MDPETRRFVTICMKWILIAVTVVYLWHFKLFEFLFVWVPWLITHEVGLVLEYGLQPVLTDHGLMWMGAGASIAVLIVFEFYTHYRHKRRDLRIGGELEGRTVWIRGVRQGLIYDVWDLTNYLAWRTGKKKGSGSRTINSFKNTVTSPGTWPDPFAIPLGERTDRDYVVYWKRRFLQLVPSKLYVSRDVEIIPSFFNYWLPNLRLVTEPHPTRPGLIVYRLVDRAPKSLKVSPARLTRENRKLLGRSKVLVSKAILSDAETQKGDFTTGSFAVPQVQEPEEVYD